MTTEHGCDRLRRPGGLGHKINGERAGGDSGFHLGEVRCEHSPLIKGGGQRETPTARDWGGRTEQLGV